MTKKVYTTHKIQAKADENGEIKLKFPPDFVLQGMSISSDDSKEREGRPTLTGFERGIIVSPDLFQLDENNVRYSFSSDLLRQYLFFWDKIQCIVSTFPNHRGHLGSPGIDLLESEGVFKKVFWNSLGQGDPISQVQHAQQMDFFMNPSELWTLGHCGQSYYAPPNQTLVDASDLDLHLIDAIELPSADVHVEKILEFKRRRSSELLRLRIELMSIRDNVLLSSTPVAARNIAMGKVASALHELNSCSRESFTERVKKSVSVSLNAKSLLEAAKTGYITMTTLGDLKLGMLAGILELGSSAIQMSISVGKKPQLPIGCKDYHYVFHAQNFLKQHSTR